MPGTISKSRYWRGRSSPWHQYLLLMIGDRQPAAEDQGRGSQRCLASCLSPAQRRAGDAGACAGPKARPGNPARQPGGSREVNLGAPKAGVHLAQGEFARNRRLSLAITHNSAGDSRCGRHRREADALLVDFVGVEAGSRGRCPGLPTVRPRRPPPVPWQRAGPWGRRGFAWRPCGAGDQRHRRASTWPSVMSASRDQPRHMTVFPGGGSRLRPR